MYITSTGANYLNMCWVSTLPLMTFHRIHPQPIYLILIPKNIATKWRIHESVFMKSHFVFKLFTVARPYSLEQDLKVLALFECIIHSSYKRPFCNIGYNKQNWNDTTNLTNSLRYPELLRRVITIHCSMIAVPSLGSETHGSWVTLYICAWRTYSLLEKYI